MIVKKHFQMTWHLAFAKLPNIQFAKLPNIQFAKRHNINSLFVI